MPTKKRYKEKEEWIVARKGPLGHYTTTQTVQRMDEITYSANKPYVSFNTCGHTRDYPLYAGASPRLPCSPIATGQIASVAAHATDEMPVKMRPTSRVTYAYSKETHRREVKPQDEEARVYDAVLAAYAQARSMPSILQPVIELRDVKQTARQATELANWLVSRPSSVRQYIRKGVTFGQVIKDFIRNTVDKSSNAYLMQAFGIMPTVGDAANIARAVANPNRFVKARSNVIPKDTVLKATFHCTPGKASLDMSSRVVGRSFQALSRSETSYQNIGIDSVEGLPELSENLLGSEDWYDIQDVHGLVFIKARVDTEVDNSLLNDWNYTQTPGSIPWELVPFSFVVDWFYDVGNQLQRAERRSNVYRRVRITDFSKPWVCTHRDRYTLAASCKAQGKLSGVTAWNIGHGYAYEIRGTVTQMVSRSAMKTYVSRSFERGPWQGHLYDLPRQDFRLPVRPYQVAASLSLLAQKFLTLGRN